MDEDRAEVEINLQVDEDISPQDMDELTAALRRELLNLDVESVDRVSAGPAPEGSRGVELAQIGALLVNLGEAAPVLGQVVKVIRAWASRAPNRTAKLTIDGDVIDAAGLSEEAQLELVKAFVARHARPPAAEASTT